MKECTLKDNPVNLTLKVLGGKWKPIILWFLYDRKIMRFNELSKELGGITQKMLIQELRELETDGLVERKVYAQVPPKVEYSMSKYGLTLKPVIQELAKWGFTHQVKSKELVK